MIFLKGDWPFYWPEHLSSFAIPEIWSSVWPTGLGGNQAIILPLKLYLQGVVWLFVNTLGIPWEITQIIFFFGLFAVLSIYSSYKLTKSWIGALIYSTNTWILLVFFGGQMGIALAYSIAPFLLKMIIAFIESSTLSPKNFQFPISNFQFPMLAGLIFAIQVMFDIRVAFLTMLVAISYSVFYHFFVRRLNIKLLTINYSLLTIVTLLLHAFWILPSVFITLRGGNVTSVVDTTSASLEFLSFAKFENSLSLLHPNWPENIFGKVAFMRPEFLIIPIISFASLVFLNSKLKTQKLNNIAIEQYNNRTFLFFALVGLIGAFLAKGTQEPFGIVFNFLYSNIPGFNLFRDPVKFYILTAISYSVLIPNFLSLLPKKNLFKLIPITFIIYWFVISLPFVTNSQVGIFKARFVPSEYAKLKEFLVSKPEFFRTLWIPSVQRFAFMSDSHPTLSFQDLFKSNFASEFKKSEFQSLLSDLSIKYVIVPYDSEGEIFLDDRKYDERLYRKTIAELNKIPRLKRVERFGKIVVFELATTKPHFFLEKGSNHISFKRKSPTEYAVNIQTQNPTRLIFSEQFDSEWKVFFDNKKIQSIPYKERINSFLLPAIKSKSPIIVRYTPQKIANIGYVVSGLTMLSVVALIGISSRKK